MGIFECQYIYLPIMQKAAKKFQQRIEIINKIQFNLSKKNGNRSSCVQSHYSQFPPIINSFVTPSKLKKTQHKNQQLRPSSKTMIQNEYQYLMTDTISQYKDQQINKIIFTNPLANRRGMRSTYYRPTHSSTLDSKSGNYLLLSKQQNNVNKQGPLLLLSPVRLQQRRKFGATSLSIKNQVTNTKSNLSSVFYTISQQSELKIVSARQGKSTKRKNQQQNIKSERCSPWKSDETYQQLLI